MFITHSETDLPGTIQDLKSLADMFIGSLAVDLLSSKYLINLIGSSEFCPIQFITVLLAKLSKFMPDHSK